VPGFKELWSSLPYKRWILFAAYVFVVPGAIWLLVCQAGMDLGVAVNCTVFGLINAFFIGWSAFAGSQVGYLVLAKNTANAKARK